MFKFKLVELSLLATGITGTISLSTLIDANPVYAAYTINPASQNSNNFETTGDILIYGHSETDSFGGNAQVFLSNTSEADDYFSFSGASAVSATDMEVFLGLNTISPNILSNKNIVQGSVFKTSFTASMNDILSFSFNFLTDEDVLSPDNTYSERNSTDDVFPLMDAYSKPNPEYNDFGFLTILFNDPNDSSVQLINFADTFYENFKDTSASTPFIKETGWLTFYSQPLSKTGSYTIGFGVADVGDAVFSSGLLLKDINLSAQSTQHDPVPEPTTIAGSLLFGCVGAWAKRKRIKKA